MLIGFDPSSRDHFFSPYTEESPVSNWMKVLMVATFGFALNCDCDMGEMALFEIPSVGVTCGVVDEFLDIPGTEQPAIAASQP